MDIILDANAYIQVIHRSGRNFLRTNQFTELVTYLRRTRSRLVIPIVTFYEVVERYRDQLTAAAKQARDAWTSLQELGMTERPRFPEPNVNGELRQLRRLLLQPSADVRSVLYTDFKDIDIWEVIRRGIKRIRPASEIGEELRDVVLWLVVIKYAKQIGDRIAFVTNDKTFAQPNGDLHANLQDDVRVAGVQVTLYQTIREFIGKNALESETVDEAFLVKYVSQDELRGIATEQILRARAPQGSIEGAEITRYALAEAKRFRVADDSYYVEAHYSGGASVKAVQATWQYVQVQPPTGYTPGTPHFGPVLGEPVAQRPFLGMPFQPPYLGAMQTSGWLVNPAPLSPFANAPVVRESHAMYTCSFDLRISLRIDGGVRESLEVDSFGARDFEPVPGTA